MHAIWCRIQRTPMANLFISYRREDSAPYAGRLSDRLSALFGSGSVFIDVLDIRPGQDFAEAIERTIAQCHVLIALIGPRWLESIQERAETRDDFVESEIAEALRKNLTVIPVLVGGAKMPEPTQLPAPLQPLCRYQAVEIRDTRFDDDFAQLAGMLRSVPGFGSGLVSATHSTNWLKWGAAVAAVLVVAGLFFFMRPRVPDLNGAWTAQMHKKGQPPYPIRLDLIISDGDYQWRRGLSNRPGHHSERSDRRT